METIVTPQHIWKEKSASIERKKLGEGPFSPPQPELSIQRSTLGLLFFLGTEAMFFAGLISAFLILRAGSATWPPLDQPRLPVAVTGINTLFLLSSAYTMHRALRAVRISKQKALVFWLSGTGFLGAIFLGVQGFEWLRLVQYGLTFNSSLYGGTFYALIGCHGLHVLAAVIVLLFVLGRTIRRRYSMENHAGIELCRIYWWFVVGIWPVLYVLIYLS
jgi:heme/copper-type cytochrome/quinol oxidase subunit 3